jgi:hypothetical protein
MNLPPNLPAKNCFRENHDHVKPWRPPEEVTEVQLIKAKQRLASRLNQEESSIRRIEKRRAKFIENAKRIAKQRGVELTPEKIAAINAASKLI